MRTWPMSWTAIAIESALSILMLVLGLHDPASRFLFWVAGYTCGIAFQMTMMNLASWSVHRD